MSTLIGDLLKLGEQLAADQLAEVSPPGWKGTTRAMKNKGAKSHLKEALDMRDLIDRYCDEKEYHNFESERGVRQLEALIEDLGYRQGINEFLSDNPGCMAAIIEWISDQRVPEWKENLEAIVGSDLDD